VARVRLTPMRKGFASAVGIILFLAAVLTSCGAVVLSTPSAELLWALAQLGVGLLIAYSIALAAVEKDLSRKGTRNQHENWVGFVGGCGVCGLVGIGLALITASDLEAGHTNLADQAGLWWSASSIGMLGIMVAILPILSYEWRKG
jgi:hypothetical protein